LSKVGKYELIRKLANGGMAEVFLARSEWAGGLKKTVVVKRILAHLTEDPSFREMFFAEAQLASLLSHPNIAQIIEFGESAGVYYLAMEYVDGLNLRTLASAAHKRDGGIPYPYCARIIAFCCEALAHAHELVDAETGKPLSLVHRDVSLDNILVSKTGSVKLVDFGIAKAATQPRRTQTGLVRGKVPYMSPEQIRAWPLDCRTDIYSLGVVLYRLIAGHKPYVASDDLTLITAILHEGMVPLRSRRADVPEGLERIVTRAMERDRDKRYSSCREFHADLEEYLLSSRQAVSALQIGQLVEKYCPPPGQPESAPPPVLATPDHSQALADASTVKVPEALPPPKLTPAPHLPASTEPIEPSSGARSRPVGVVIAMILSSVALLAASGVVLRRPRQSVEPGSASQPAAPAPARVQAQESPAEKPVVTEAATGVAPPPPAISEPEAVEAPHPVPRQTRPASPWVELKVRSQPPAMIKIFSGNKLRESHWAQATAKVPPGPVEVEVSGSGGQPFSRRESFTVQPLPRSQERTIAVEQGTLMIRSLPPSHVKVDGVARGDVPLRLQLYEGPHAVVFECDRSASPCAGVTEAKQNITVQPGKTVNVIQRWP